MTNEERIWAYYDGMMSIEEKEDFLKEIESNEALKQEWELYGKVIEGIQSEGEKELRDYIKSRVQRDENISESNLWFYAAATVTVLLLGYFVVYSFVTTNSIQEASEVITLKDEKSKSLRFWEKSKKDFKPKPSSEPRSPYLDSIELLEQSIASEDTTNAKIANLDSSELLVYAQANDPIAEDNDILIPEYEKTEESVSILSEKEVASRTSKVTLSPRPTAVNANHLGKDSDIDTLEEVLLVTLRILPIRLQIPQDSGVTTKIETKKSNIPTFQLQRYENNLGRANISVTIKENATLINLYNLWGENPLIYHIREKYYLDLGNQRIWEIPEKNTPKTEASWVIDKDILQVISNE